MRRGEWRPLEILLLQVCAVTGTIQYMCAESVSLCGGHQSTLGGAKILKKVLNNLIMFHFLQIYLFIL